MTNVRHHIAVKFLQTSLMASSKREKMLCTVTAHYSTFHCKLLFKRVFVSEKDSKAGKEKHFSKNSLKLLSSISCTYCLLQWNVYLQICRFPAEREVINVRFIL